VTLTDDVQQITTETADVAPNRVPSAPRPRAPIRKRVIAITVIAISTLLAFAVVFQLFEGPFANVWYRTRQRALVADFNATHEHAGAGHAIAILQVPRLDINVAVAEGDNPQQLRGGPGHRTDTPLPGVVGNSVVVGHARDWGGPFSRLRELKKGDLIAVQTYGPGSSLQTGVYTVQSTAAAGAADISPFVTSDDFRLTLVSGEGGRFSDKRFIVTAVSGTAGQVRDAKPATVASTAAGSTTTNSATLFAVIGLGGALIAFVLLRKRYHVIACWAVVAPLVLIGSLGVLFDVDLLLAPLR
jgi:sortase A